MVGKTGRTCLLLHVGYDHATGERAETTEEGVDPVTDDVFEKNIWVIFLSTNQSKEAMDTN